MEMQITLNQRSLTIPSGLSLLALLEREGLLTAHIAVAVNHSIVARTQWSETMLQEGANILVIGAVKGG